MTRFSDEEKSIISMYNTADRVGLIVKIKEAIPYIEDADLKNTAADIVRIRKSTKSHVSTSLKVLEDRGLIERRVDPANKKRVTIHLLQLANEVIEDGKWAQKEFAQDMFDGLTEEEIKVFMNVFQKVYDNAARMISNE